MSTNEQELEIKLYLNDLLGFKKHLESLGARLVQARVHEINFRFDTPTGDLGRTLQVLRLRQDTAAHLTYKGPGETQGGVYLRREIEFTVGDFKAARTLLEALGYQVSVMYEKYRTTYELDGVLVTLDEMPFGNFAEIEGPDPASIHVAAQKLGVDWEARIAESYISLFEKLRVKLNLDFRDLSFANFAGMDVSTQALGVQPADHAIL